MPSDVPLGSDDLRQGYSALPNSEPYLFRPLLRVTLFFDAVPFDALLVSFSMAALLSSSSSAIVSPTSSSSF